MVLVSHLVSNNIHQLLKIDNLEVGGIGYIDFVVSTEESIRVLLINIVFREELLF